VSLVELDGRKLKWVKVDAARFALNEQKKVLGAGVDVHTTTDERGYFHLYFQQQLLGDRVTLSFGDPEVHRQEWLLAPGRRNFEPVSLPVNSLPPPTPQPR
jgi:hypothetical protein